MDASTNMRKLISAYLDGELSPADLELARAALTTVEGQAAWLAYQRVGALLRAVYPCPSETGSRMTE